MKTYTVMVKDPSSWHPDGSPVYLRDCGHKHTTLSGAHRCLCHLTRKLSDGMYSADWYHAEIRHSDGSKLSPEEILLLLAYVQGGGDKRWKIKKNKSWF